MTNASLKEQLQAMASQLSDSPLSDKLGKEEEIKPNSKAKPKSKPMSKANYRPNPGQMRNPKAPKPKWLEYVLYGVELLKAYFPLCFKSPNEVQPLKKGIKQDLVKFLSTIDTIVIEDKACMVKTLSYYVNTAAYHKSVVEGATRIDLDGNPAGVVSAEEAKYSFERQQLKLQAKQTAAPNLQAKTKEEIAL